MKSKSLNKYQNAHLKSKDSKNHYIPALKFNWLTKGYDFILKYTMPEKAFKSKLIEYANISADQNVLDFGCGTATLSLLTKEIIPDAHVVGIDVDKKALQIAKNKIAKSITEVKLIKIVPGEFNFEDHTFDRIISSLVFHHLTDDEKIESLKGLHKILKINGSLTIVDWGKPSNPLMRGLFYLVQFLDGFETTTSNVKGKLPIFIKEAGFRKVEILRTYNTIYGSLSIYQAIKN